MGVHAGCRTGPGRGRTSLGAGLPAGPRGCKADGGGGDLHPAQRRRDARPGRGRHRRLPAGPGAARPDGVGLGRLCGPGRRQTGPDRDQPRVRGPGPAGDGILDPRGVGARHHRPRRGLAVPDSFPRVHGPAHLPRHPPLPVRRGRRPRCRARLRLRDARHGRADPAERRHPALGGPRRRTVRGRADRAPRRVRHRPGRTRGRVPAGRRASLRGPELQRRRRRHRRSGVRSGWRGLRAADVGGGRRRAGAIRRRAGARQPGHQPARRRGGR